MCQQIANHIADLIADHITVLIADLIADHIADHIADLIAVLIADHIAVLIADHIADLIADHIAVLIAILIADHIADLIAYIIADLSFIDFACCGHSSHHYSSLWLWYILALVLPALVLVAPNYLLRPDMTFGCGLVDKYIRGGYGPISSATVVTLRRNQGVCNHGI